VVSIRYGDSVDNTVKENSISKGVRAVKLHQQNHPVLNWNCRLTQIELYNGRKKVGVVVIMVISGPLFFCLSV